MQVTVPLLPTTVFVVGLDIINQNQNHPMIFWHDIAIGWMIVLLLIHMVTFLSFVIAWHLQKPWLIKALDNPVDRPAIIVNTLLSLIPAILMAIDHEGLMAGGVVIMALGLVAAVNAMRLKRIMSLTERLATHKIRAYS